MLMNVRLKFEIKSLQTSSPDVLIHYKIKFTKSLYKGKVLHWIVSRHTLTTPATKPAHTIRTINEAKTAQRM